MCSGSIRSSADIPARSCCRLRGAPPAAGVPGELQELPPALQAERPRERAKKMPGCKAQLGRNERSCIQGRPTWQSLRFWGGLGEVCGSTCRALSLLSKPLGPDSWSLPVPYPHIASLWRGTSRTSKFLTHSTAQNPSWFSSSSPHVQPQTFHDRGQLRGRSEASKRQLAGGKILLEELGLSGLEVRRDSVAVFNYVEGCCKGCGNKLFFIPTGNGTSL